MTKIRLDFIGCRLNISEIERLGRQFQMAGHQLVGPGENAELCVFNSCTVTHIADRSSRQRIRRLKRDNPGAVVIVTGCYAEMSPDAVAALDVDLIVGNEDKDRIVQLATEAGLLYDEDLIPAPDASFPLPESAGGHTRAFVKVQDGCDNHCTYCIVTVARGVGRSRSISDVVAEIRQLRERGYQEAVLTGVHLGSFGHERGERDGLKKLVRAILSETDLPRLRLSSLEPWDLAPDFFELWKNPRLCRHLHLPLQSGSDAVLKRMARRTTQKKFCALVESARRAIPGLAVSTDVIVGFPGESEAEFADSLAFIERMNFSRTHIFRFSGRKGTAAYAMPGQVDPQIAQERSQRLHDVAARHERTFRQSLLGQTLPVLWESSEDTPAGTLWSGLTDNYVRVSAFSAQNRHNQITPAFFFDLLPDAVAARISQERSA
ncbi:MAG: tRNA (N(6)-L-threonylcarbamoyladenosine(37)-C(2))-methylthiotransferase MtaB [Anaerolineaceae bacterium 4572_5.2]|nr:MAG: tRNA (N(6)-L-threonylcarbamoyladenosine(37)-C(2))-methylthiotransferase MtaB [Anaerolineaceae bacterium 4572_5.2]